MFKEIKQNISRPNLMLLLFLGGFLGTLLTAIHFSPFYVNKRVNSLDLSGDWMVCAPKEPVNSKNYGQQLETCRWQQGKVPELVSTKRFADYNGWLIYRKKFDPPSWCLSGENACAVLGLEIIDAVEVRINGEIIGRHGQFPPKLGFFDINPIRFFLKNQILEKATKDSEITVVTYSPRRVVAGLYRGPFWIMPFEESALVVQASVASIVALPVMTALGLFTIALICLLTTVHQKNTDLLLKKQISYCLFTGLFLLSLSRLPRQYLHYNIGYDLHFLSRAVSEFSFFNLICYYFSFNKKIKSVFRLLLLCPIIYLSVTLGMDLFGFYPFGNVGGFDTVYPFARYSSPLWFLPVLLGLYCSFQVEGFPNRKIFLIIFFATLSTLIVSDNFAFWRVIPESYFVRFYPFLVASIFGYLIFQQRLKERKDLEVAASMGLFATQVAHDIRSPLTALDMAVGDLKNMPEENRLMVRSSVNRIRDIANGLLVKYKQGTPQSEPTLEIKNDPQLISSLIESLVTEKRLQYRSKLGVSIESKIDSAAYGVFAKVQASEFQRAVSNLINNSVEAIKDHGRVTIDLVLKDEQMVLSIQDNGKGIPEEVLPRIMNPGVSFDKESGSGLGLHHAKQTVESWGGTISIKSKLGEGTAVTMTLPKSENPSWFASEIKLGPNASIVIIDDDASIHQIWQRRLSCKLFHFSTPGDFVLWFDSEGKKIPNVHYLFDYEFIGSSLNGIELIQRCDLQDRSILVTSHYEEKQIQELCVSIGVRILPKNLASVAPIVHKSESVQDIPPSLDAILVDDDRLIQTAWRVSARQKKKTIECFGSASDFLNKAKSYDFQIPLYIDVNLGNGQRGEDLAKQAFELGFQNIYLATGYTDDQFKNNPYIKGVQGKEPPWSVA